MLFAKDRSGIELPAAKAVAGAHYVCPVCGEDVFVRLGSIRVPHFAHRSGRANPECENYHPGGAIRNPLSPSYQTWPAGGVHIMPPALGLWVEPAARRSRKDLCRWRLVLTIPRSPSQSGRMRIPTGFGAGVREVPLSRLAQESQEIEVSPNASHFGPEWVSDEVRYDYRQIVSRRLDGFSPEYAQAFAATGGKLKSPASSLEWGESYYVIWKRKDFAIPEAVTAQRMATYEGWCAALVSLPPAPSDEITDWIEQGFGLRLHQAKRHWGILFPPPIDIDIDGNVLISNARNVLLSFGMAADDEASTVSIGSGGAIQDAVSLRPRTDTVLRVAREQNELTTGLTLYWGAKQLPSVVAIEISEPAATLPAILFEIRDTKLGAHQRCLLHRPEGRNALDLVRSGCAELISVSLPCGVRGLLECRDAGGDWQPVLVLQDAQESPRGGSWSLTSERLLAITDALRDTRADVRLVFGAFGDYLAFARRESIPVRPPISSDTKRRLLWYCRANGVAHRAGRRAIELCSDGELLELLHCQPPRAHLIAHRNLLERRLLIERRESPTP